MQQEEIPRAVILDFADRLLRGLDDAIAAISEGYVRVEVEAAAAHSERRRAVLEDLLSAPRTTPRDRARIRLRAQRHGLAVEGSYRLVLVHVPGAEESEIESRVDQLEGRIRVPASHHRQKPGIRLPVVLDWRAHVLVFAAADWTGEQRLREALPQVLGDDIVVIDTGPVEGVEDLADALTHADYSATVASALGRRGWIGDPGSLALETTFLLDRQLVRNAVDRELGPLLTDPRMGEELIETLQVYLGSKQNIREAARRLHLAPRTVAYRLERIESLLGETLEGDVTLRLSAALLALRVDRETGGLGPEVTDTDSD
jgi:DNA-binding PucR family transcriptional regulator